MNVMCEDFDLETDKETVSHWAELHTMKCEGCRQEGSMGVFKVTDLYCVLFSSMSVVDLVYCSCYVNWVPKLHRNSQRVGC